MTTVTVKTLEHDFLPLRVEDWKMVHDYLKLCEYEESNHNIVNMMMWLKWYPLFYCRTEKYLLLLGMHEGEFFMYMPLCRPEHFEEAIRKGKSIFDYYETPFVLECYTKSAMDQVIAIFPGYRVCPIPEMADYVYETEKLISFAGKALQKKRNHLNAFYRENEGRWQYETMTAGNVEDCKAFLQGWKEADGEAHLQEEKEGTGVILDMFGELPYKGGLIRIDGEVRAFAIGTVLSDRMAQENIEKADDSVRGLYQAIMKEFLAHEMAEYPYVNREDAYGSENLAHAKEAYHPVFMIDKYRFCRCGEGQHD